MKKTRHVNQFSIDYQYTMGSSSSSNFIPNRIQQWRTEQLSNITTTINIDDPVGGHQRSQRLIGLARGSSGWVLVLTWRMRNLCKNLVLDVLQVNVHLDRILKVTCTQYSTGTNALHKQWLHFAREELGQPGDTGAISINVLHWNLSVTTTSLIKLVNCDLFSNVF